MGKIIHKIKERIKATEPAVRRGVIIGVISLVLWLAYAFLGNIVVMILAYVASLVTIWIGMDITSKANKIKEEKEKSAKRKNGIAIVAIPFIAFIISYIITLIMAA